MWPSWFVVGANRPSLFVSGLVRCSWRGLFVWTNLSFLDTEDFWVELSAERHRAIGGVLEKSIPTLTLPLMKFFLTFLAFAAATASSLAQENKKAPMRDDIALGGKLDPRQEEPIFAVVSKQGMRVLVSRDDGKTWEQTFLATDHREDGGYHGNYAVYGMTCTGGVIGVFSGWGADGIYIGSDDGKNWAHLNSEKQQLGSVWGAAGGNGVMLTSADQWRGMTISDNFKDWRRQSVSELLAGDATHHMIAGFGNFSQGTFIVVGDNQQVFYSHDNGKKWERSRIPAEAGAGQNSIAFGNGVFLCAFKDHVARSSDGGATWALHPHGLQDATSWNGLSFAKEIFWLAGRGGKAGRFSRDGIQWKDLPKGTPGGVFIEGESGTLINIERGRGDIQRSTDGKNWKTVFESPVKANEYPTWSFTYGVYGKVNRVK